MPRHVFEVPADSDIASAYALMIDNPGIGVRELAGRLDRSPEAAGDLIERMLELSLLEPAEQEGAPFIPKHPILAIHRMVEREAVVLDEHWQRLMNNYQALLSVLPRIAAGSHHVAEHRPAERIGGPDDVHQTVESLITHARGQILAFMPPTDDRICAAVADRMLHVAALQKDLSRRVIYSESGHAAPAGPTRPAELQASGTEIRTVPDVPLWLIIVDRDTAVVPTDDTSLKGTALLIRDSGTITALTALFESYWEHGSVLLDQAPGPCDCSPLDRGILRQLAGGQTDEVVARHLGISVRTLRRRIAALMKQLNAQSRFELAIEATTCGWLEPSGTQ